MDGINGENKIPTLIFYVRTLSDIFYDIINWWISLMDGINSLPAKFVLAGTKLILFGRYLLKFYLGIVQ
jgi:hypothetical protein